MKKTTLSLLLITLLISCEKEKKNDHIFVGPKKEVHDGKAWSWIRLGNDGAPQQLGISIDDAALNSVPTEGTGHDGGHHSHQNNIVLPLHQKALQTTLFKTIGLDWNPAGHPPANIYTKPHFDFHFYSISEAERLAAIDPVKLNADPAPEYLPANHVGVDPVPQMGKHWVDITSPELAPVNPAPFTQTFIYGSYDSKVSFYEPMITLEFLKNTTQFERSIPQPAKVAETGYYPTKMKVIKHDGLTEIILEGFTKRQAS